MSTQLRAVPELSEHHVHAAALTREHEHRMITLAGKDGTRLRALLDGTAPSLTTGFTVLWLDGVGTKITIAVPDLAPVYVHPVDTD